MPPKETFLRLSKTQKLLLVLALLLAVLYSSDNIVFRVFDKADSALWPHQRFCAALRTKVGKTLDSLNPFYNNDHILSSLDVYSLTLSPRDIQYIFQLGKKKADGPNWVKPKKSRHVLLKHAGETYKVQMKLHGDTVSHWSGKKKSFRIKSPKDRFIGDKNSLAFNIPEKRGYLIPLFANEVADQLGLIAPKGDYVAVKINNIFQGTYYMEEWIDKHFLERNHISNGCIVEISDNWIDDRLEAGNDPNKFFGGITYNGHHTTPFDLEIADLKTIPSPITGTPFGEAPSYMNQEIAKKTENLFDAIRLNDVELFESLVDIPKIGAIDAWRTLLGDVWTLEGDNIRMVYRLTQGKFFFIARNQGMLRLVNYKGGSFEHDMNRTNVAVPLWNMMTKSEKIRTVRNEWLYYFVQHREELLAEYDAIMKKYLPALLQDNTLPNSSREIRHKMEEARQNLVDNLDHLTAQLNYAKIYLNADVDANTLTLTFVPDTSLQLLEVEHLGLALKKNHAFAPSEKIRLETLGEDGKSSVLYEGLWDSASNNLASLFAGQQFGYDFDAEFLPIPKRYRFRLTFENQDNLGLDAISLQMKTSLSHAILEPNDTYVMIAKTYAPLANPAGMSLADFLSQDKSIAWQVDGKNLILKKGRYTFTHDYFIPKGYRVILEKGVEILMAAKITLTSFSPFTAEGTADEKISMRALDPAQPFNALVISGTEHDMNRFTYFEFSDAKETVTNGMYLSGGFNIYHGDLAMDHCKVEHGHADDGLNVKYGNIHLVDSIFNSNYADQIDLDFCVGVIERCYFHGPANGDENGDGLDISGSHLLVKNCTFEKLTDKGMSIGEDSYLVAYNNKLIGNSKGSSVKDTSSALFYKNSFQDNKVTLAAYRKKPIFQGGHAFAYDNEWKKDESLFKFDEFSSFFVPTAAGIAFLKKWSPDTWDPMDIRFFHETTFWERSTDHANH